MKTIVGLGNPGKDYENTRHNVGRELSARIAKHFGFDKPEENDRYLGAYTTGKIGKEKAAILTPDTFMNKSGKAVTAAKIKPKDLILIHDDSDIALGTVKIAFGKNSGGHKGVESVMRAVKSKDFWRIRVGVQKSKRVPAENLVLQKFREPEKKIIKKIDKRIFETLEKGLSVTTISVS